MRPSGLAALLALVVTVGLAAGPPRQTETIKLATLIPQGSFWDRALRDMGAEWEALTDGRVRLRIYAGGVAGDDADMIRKIRIGQLQAATVTVSGLTEIDPAFALFEVPMFFASYDELFHLLSVLGPELERRLLAKGFRLLHWGHGGWLHFFTTRPVGSLEELRKLRIFVWAGNDRMTALWRRHGFRPVPLAATDIMTGLQTGLFQALPSTPIAALSLQWFRSAPHMLDLPLAPLVGASLIDERAWKRLPEEHRQALLAAAADTGALFAEQIPAEEQRAVAEMERRGLGIGRVVGSDEEVRWRASTLEFAESIRETFVPADFYDRAVAVRDAYRRSRE
ncbi:MAG: TRAP transporter substrate-binding protein DctP [Acidobacteria bacterium]|nr:TRAP transporter substrate-binding protein DctP [Acidobacteriota bacterium]